MYIIKFSVKEGYITQDQYQKIFVLGDEIGAMLWSVLRKM